MPSETKLPETKDRNLQYRFSDLLRKNATQFPDLKLSDHFILGCDLWRAAEQRLSFLLDEAGLLNLGRKITEHPDPPEFFVASLEFSQAIHHQISSAIDNEKGWIGHLPDHSKLSQYPEMVEGIEAYRKASFLYRKGDGAGPSDDIPAHLSDKVNLILLTLEELRVLSARKIGSWVHDIRNKLTFILGNLGLARTDLPSELSHLTAIEAAITQFNQSIKNLHYNNLGEFFNYLNEILPQFNDYELYLTHLLINDLPAQTRAYIINTSVAIKCLSAFMIDFQKDTGGKRSQFETLDIHRFIHDLADYSRSFSDSVQFEHCSETDVDLLVKANKSDIIRVFEILVKNAHEALEQTKDRDKKITLKTAVVDSKLQIQCINNGPPIAPEHLHQIFNYQFTTKSSVAGESRGVGLYTCKEIVGEYGGTIKAENTADGVCFTVILPLHQET